MINPLDVRVLPGVEGIFTLQSNMIQTDRIDKRN